MILNLISGEAHTPFDRVQMETVTLLSMLGALALLEEEGRPSPRPPCDLAHPEVLSHKEKSRTKQTKNIEKKVAKFSEYS